MRFRVNTQLTNTFPLPTSRASPNDPDPDERRLSSSKLDEHLKSYKLNTFLCFTAFGKDFLFKDSCCKHFC